MLKKRAEHAEERPAFESSLAELEQIVAKLEGGQMPLSEALAAYELGVKRLNNCYQILEHAERRIELVRSVSVDGRAQTTPLDDVEDDDLAEKSAARGRRRSAKPASPSNGQNDEGSSLF
ncbi:MAG: exodeoxyribonuclease VII small subunit [Pirellulales bacterium]|nr:exodeoxyribonuclease VII small subunit [Pirellulales bacterium]